MAEILKLAIEVADLVELIITRKKIIKFFTNP